MTPKQRTHKRRLFLRRMNKRAFDDRKMADITSPLSFKERSLHTWAILALERRALWRKFKFKFTKQSFIRGSRCS